MFTVQDCSVDCGDESEQSGWLDRLCWALSIGSGASGAVPAAKPLLEAKASVTAGLMAAISAALSVTLTLSQVPKSFGHGTWLPRDGFKGGERFSVDCGSVSSGLKKRSSCYNVCKFTSAHFPSRPHNTPSAA